MRLTREPIERAAFVLAAIGCAAVMLRMGTGFVRFDVPKEVALHLFVVALVVRAIARREQTFDDVDRGAGLFLLSLLPALAFAFAPALLLRQGALTMALVALFVFARESPDTARLAAIATGVVLAASGFGEALGCFSLSAHGFAPGGLVGQRNHLAHAAALALALLFASPSPADRRFRVPIGASAAVLAGAIVLTRCRTGYLAAFAAAVLAIPLLRDRESSARLSLFGTLIGALSATVVPVSMSWTTEHPYLDSVERLFEVSRGSGAVRVDEAKATLKLLGHHPIFGVGAGQWSAEYIAVAPPKVRALAVADGSVPRLSHGDLLARVAEGGIVGMLGALAWSWASIRALHAQSVLLRATPFAAAFVLVELLDAGISIPATGIVAALGAASFFPRDASRAVGRPWTIGAALMLVAVSCAAIALLVRVRAADRVFVVDERPAELVRACELDGTAASHCVDAARRALVVGDHEGAARAVSALERSYREHPAAPMLRHEINDR